MGGYGGAGVPEQQRGRAHVGCSGWNYRDWRGLVYPEGLPQRRWFSHYATLFGTVEVNNTFYRLPARSTMDAWAAQAPAGFVYAVKLGAYGSHRRKLTDPGAWLPNHVDRVERLAEHLGPTLVHLPPRWRRNVERLDEFLSVAPSRLRWAVEFRDPSWLHDDVFEVLRRHSAALCIHDLLPEHPWIRTAHWTYVRFHGPDALNAAYWGRYGPERLEPAAARLGAWLDGGCDVYAYFNNDYEASAVADGHWLASRLGVARPDPPR